MAVEPIIIRVATQGAQKAATDLQGVSRAAGGVAGKATAVAAAAAAAAAGMLAWIDSTVAMIDEMGTLQAASGLTARQINALRLAASQADKSLKDVVPKDLSKRLRDAQEGSEKTKQAFADLGIEGEDLHRSVSEIFPELLTALNKVPDDGRRAALAFETMGKQGRNLLSTTLANADELERFAKIGDAIATKTGPDMVTVMTDWQEATAELSVASEYLSNQLSWVITLTSRFVKLVAGGVIVAASQAEQAFGRWAKVMEGDFLGVLADVQEDALGFQTSLKKVDEILGLVEGGAPKTAGEIEDLGDETEAAGGKVDKATRHLQAFREELGPTTTDVLQLRKQLADLAGTELEQISAALDLDIERLDEQIEGYRALGDQSGDTLRAIVALEELRAAKIEESQQRFLAAQQAEGDGEIALTGIVEEERERQAASRQGALDGWLAYGEKVAEVLGGLSDLAGAVAQAIDGSTARAQRAAQVLLGISKGLAYAEIAVKTAVAIASALALGPAAPLAIAGIVATSAQQVLAVRSASLGGGGGGQTGSSSLTPRYDRAPIGSRQPAMSPYMVVAFDHQTLGALELQQLEDRRSPLSRRLRRRRPQPLGRKR